MADKNLNQFVWLGIAVLMLTPIPMVFLTLALPQSVSRLVNIIVAAFFLLFNLVGLPTYASLYDKNLLAVSMGFNVITILYAWNWSGIGVEFDYLLILEPILAIKSYNILPQSTSVSRPRLLRK